MSPNFRDTICVRDKETRDKENDESKEPLRFKDMLEDVQGKMERIGADA